MPDDKCSVAYIINDSCTLYDSRRFVIECLSMGRFPQELYEIAADEVAQRNVVRGIMAKAFTNAGGDEKKAIAYYIEYRAAQLAQEAREALRQKRRAAAHVAVSNFRPVAFTVMTLVFGALAVVFLIMGVAELVDPKTQDPLAPAGLALFSFLMATGCGVCGFLTYRFFKKAGTRE